MTDLDNQSSEVEVLDKDIDAIRVKLAEIAKESGSQVALIAAVTLIVEQMRLNDIELVSMKTIEGEFEGYIKPVSH